MNRGLQTQAFTIMETLIVLAVTGMLLVSGMIFISGRQQRTSFYQAINDVQSQINDVINTVSTGYYAGNDNLTCTLSGGDLDVSNTNSERGTNKDCIYIGRAMQFGVDGSNGEDYIIYDLVGKQYSSPGVLVSSKDQAMPMALTHLDGIFRGPGPGVDTSQKRKLLYGLNISKMYVNDNSTNDVGVVAFITSFSSYGAGGLNSGAKSVDLYYVGNTHLNLSQFGTLEAINTPGVVNKNVGADPLRNIILCFNGSVPNQKGTITIGSNNSQLKTDLKIENGSC